MKRVLFIAYHFPPLAGGGTFRSLKFVKYLPEFGWLSTVVTTNTKNYWAYDEELLKEVPPEVKIIRAPEIDPFYLQLFLSKIGIGKLYQKIKNRFFIPDEKIGWIPFAFRKAVRELKRQKYDLIFSTSPTPCAHIIALKLKREFGIPWVADYRDLWTLNPEYPYSKNLKRYHREFQIEKFIAQSCNDQIHVTKGNLNNIRNYFNLYNKHLKLIYNGYDIITIAEPTEKKENDYLKFVYTGTFYGLRNPTSILKAISEIAKAEPKVADSLRLQFIGKSDTDIINNTASLGIRKMVSHVNNLPQSEIDNIYQKTDVSVLIIPCGQSHILTSKIFDYLYIKKPILAIIPNGEAKEILIKSNLGFFADPNSPEDIKRQILNLYRLWKTDQLHVEPNYEYIEQFHRHYLTKQLAEVFNSLV
jgi:glycosyltransferase involved in cell wall biosynthesis